MINLCNIFYYLYGYQWVKISSSRYKQNNRALGLNSKISKIGHEIIYFDKNFTGYWSYNGPNMVHMMIQ